MNKNVEFTKRIFDIISRLKRSDVHAVGDMENDIRPSEEMFLIKIDMLSIKHNVKINDLVNMSKFAPSTISTILKALEDKGYVTREVNKDNRREVFVKIKDSGKLKLEAAKKRHFDMVSDLISYLGEEDARKLIEILEKTTCFFENKKSGREKQQ